MNEPVVRRAKIEETAIMLADALEALSSQEAPGNTTLELLAARTLRKLVEKRGSWPKATSVIRDLTDHSERSSRALILEFERKPTNEEMSAIREVLSR